MQAELPTGSCRQQVEVIFPPKYSISLAIRAGEKKTPAHIIYKYVKPRPRGTQKSLQW